jgi:hypothetical protein
MKKIFLYLLRKYSKDEAGRMEIMEVLWEKVNDDYPEQTAFGNVYLMGVEFFMSNPFFRSRVNQGNSEHLKMIQGNINDSISDSIEFIQKK